MMRTLAIFSRTLQYEFYFVHDQLEKDIVGLKIRSDIEISCLLIICLT